MPRTANPNTETTQQIVDRIRASGALSPALMTALDEVATQMSGLEDELRKARKQFRVLTAV